MSDDCDHENVSVTMTGTDNTITSSSGVTCDDCGDQLTEPTE